MNIQLKDIKNDIARAVTIALEEDIGDGDITAELIPADQTNEAEIITREDCTLCGQAWLDETYRQLGGLESIEWQAKDGDRLSAGATLVKLKGNTRRLLTGERTALNFLQLLSGTATTASVYAAKLGDSQIELLDTRKTIPGLRTAQKYAVATGGCHNHRIGLYDAFLIKENHIAACGSISKAIDSAKFNHPEKAIEVEVENITELREAISAKADIIMLDNFSLEALKKIESIGRGQSKLELSGNLTLSTIETISNHKEVDYVSSGALTKHIKAIDLSFRINK